jgi:hypothetical protein
MKNKAYLQCIFAFFLMFTDCKRGDSVEFYHSFENKKWNRFEHISFLVPVHEHSSTCDIDLILWRTHEFEYSTFDFNLIMNTPSGEERIREYHVPVSSQDRYFQGDSCEMIISLKKGIVFQQNGVLRIDIEALIPRVEILGVSRVGVRMIRRS